MIQSLLWLLLVPALAFSSAKTEIVFAGVLEGNGPAFERTLERLVRERLVMNPAITLRDESESIRFRKSAGIGTASALTQSMLESIRKYSLDSTLFVYAAIEKYSISGTRRFVVGSAVRAEAVLSLTMYSYARKEFLFAGAVHCAVTIPKDLLAPYSVRSMHISGPERVRAQEELALSGAHEVAHTVEIVCRSGNPTHSASYSRAGTDRDKQPSISEIFDFPTSGAYEAAVQDSAQLDGKATSSEKPHSVGQDSTGVSLDPATTNGP